MRRSLILVILGLLPLLAENIPPKSIYVNGSFYLDWYGARYQENDYFNQVSARIKLELFNRPGSGWSLKLDGRNQLNLNRDKNNRVILYDASLTYDRSESPIYFSAGQMNLYDTGGIGQLLGGVIGFKPTKYLLLGGYAGLESNAYIKYVESDYWRLGFFGQYQGSLGKRLSFSLNQLRYSGISEKKYLHFSGMIPIKKYLVLYGNTEYQLGDEVESGDRLSRLFFNLRFDPSSLFDMVFNYSSGKGLDFHRFAMEKSQDPSLNDKSMERFYYSRQYGVRFSLKPNKNLRFSMARMEMEQKDRKIKNHTWIFSGAAYQIFNTGISAYGSYRLNRGEMSESDSYDITLNKEFGRISWSMSFTNTYNYLRFDGKSAVPQLIHRDDYKTISTFLFILLNRELALSFEYEYYLQENAGQHLFFMRFIYRKSR
ncbi:MAG: hypothetical protein JW755_00775 [Candidatus Aminicenantes bacterium]|nr:hypothetical protein [Candidatus Aminicenantes bacterium]